MSAVSISLILFDLLFNIAIAYFYCKIGEIDFNFKNWKKTLSSFVILFISAFFTSYLVQNVTPGIRFWTKFLMEVLTYAVLFHQSRTRNLMISLLLFLTCGIAELIVVLGAAAIFQISPNNWRDTVGNIAKSNILIWVMYVLVLSLPSVQRLYRKITHWYSNKDFLTLSIISIIGLYCSAFLLMENFKGVNDIALFCINNIFSFGVIILVIILIVEKGNNNRIIEAYDKLMEYIKVYEKVITERGKQQHEYKNQLILIRSMIKSDDKKTVQYINEQLKIETTDKKMILFSQLKNVPEGGLKGLIYYKIEEMEKNGINVFISVDSQLENEKLWKVCDRNLQDISRIIGVYLDNAAESAKNAEQKYFAIDISYENKSIIFSFSNSYSGTLDVANINKDGFTTKGINRGFGLSLVRDILVKNRNLSQEREINGKFYVQKLIVNKNEL